MVKFIPLVFNILAASIWLYFLTKKTPDNMFFGVVAGMVVVASILVAVVNLLTLASLYHEEKDND